MALAVLLSPIALGPACAQTSRLPLDAPIPADVPPGTVLRVGDPKTQVALELSGQLKTLPFKVEWANLSGGPQTLEAFRAGALDVGSVADIPPIFAKWTGLDVKVVAASFRIDPINHPIYQLGVAPHAKIDSLADLRGKTIAYSPGQAQGALVLRILQKESLAKTDVTLVEMPSTGDVYVNALASGLVDAAPISEGNRQRFLAKYQRDGGKLLFHGLRDDPWYLYARTAVVQDPAKAAALRDFVKAWGRATRWIDEHPTEWVAGYYVKNQGLRPDDGKYLVTSAGRPDVPETWDDVLKRQQATIDLLAKETNKPPFPAIEIFDRRYEHIAAEGFGSP